MNRITTFTVTLLLLFGQTRGESPLEVKPGSEEWKQLYDPPFEKPSELGADSPLRKQLFNQLRPKVEAIAKQPVQFQGSLRAFRNWAFFGGRSLDEKGVSLKLPELDNDDTVALWLRTTDGWKLVDYAAGHSDAFFIIWPEQYGMPADLLKDIN
jgi:hypothetical protein